MEDGVDAGHGVQDEGGEHAADLPGREPDQAVAAGSRSPFSPRSSSSVVARVAAR